MGDHKFEKDVQDIVARLQGIKSQERNEESRKQAIAITELEKAAWIVGKVFDN